jgi:nucleotide-binding universal stress UspA family protein
VTEQPVIVVGCDGGPRSDAALRFAADEAELRGARLIIVAAYPGPMDPDLDQFDTPDNELRAQAYAQADRSRQRALGPSVARPPHEIVVLPGDPARVLLELGRNAIMIVIGRSERSLLARLFGHVTGRKLVRHTDVPVVVVPVRDPAVG